MVLSLSAVLLLGALVVVLYRYAGLRAWHAAVCALFGFLLASSSVAPYVTENVRYLARLLSGLQL